MKNVFRHIAQLVLIFSLSFSLLRAEGALTSGYEFLNTDYNARSAAMGRAFLTMRGDVSGLFVNPAGMAYTETKQAAADYTNYLLDVNAGLLSYAHVLPNIGVLSVGLIYMDYGSFKTTDENAVEIGTFSAADMAISVGLANHLGKGFSYGINLKYIHSNIEQFSANAAAVDFSLLYKASFQQDLYFVAVVQNLGGTISSYGDIKEPLPTNIGLGFSKKLAHLPLEIAFSFNDLNASTDDFADRFKGFSVGGEFRLSKMLRFRLGYNNNLHRGLDVTDDVKLSGVSTGFGIIWRAFGFDYAYSNVGLLGSTHRFGFKMNIL